MKTDLTPAPGTVLPIIHLNGSSPDTLLAAYTAARVPLFESMRLLQETAPNARDYYPGPDYPENLRLATAQHEARWLALARVDNELIALVEHCQAFIEEREARRTRLYFSQNTV